MKIKIEPFLMPKGMKVAKGAIEFPPDCLLEGFHLVGFTIMDDPQKGLYVLFPSSQSIDKEGIKKQFFFLRPDNPSRLEKLEKKILDQYEDMIEATSGQKKDNNRA